MTQECGLIKTLGKTKQLITRADGNTVQARIAEWFVLRVAQAEGRRFDTRKGKEISDYFCITRRRVKPILSQKWVLTEMLRNVFPV